MAIADHLVDSSAWATLTKPAVVIPGLILAAVTERHDITILHYDHDFDMIAEITGQPVEWVMSPGSAD